MNELEELKIYVQQLEEENLRLKHSNKSLRNNNNGILKGLNKIQSELSKYKKRYGSLDDILVKADE